MLTGSVGSVGSMETIDSKPIGIKEAMKRYGINSPTTWAEWLKIADIQSFQMGREKYIYRFQLEKLDAIARERNRPINTSSGGSVGSVMTERFQEPEVLEVSDTVKLMTSFLEVLQSRTVNTDPDENLMRLERYAQNHWRITSNELAPLIGLKSMPKSPYKRKGFLFEREGLEWKVSKLKE